MPVKVTMGQKNERVWLQKGDRVKSKHMPNVQLWVDRILSDDKHVLCTDKKGHVNKFPLKDLTLGESVKNEKLDIERIIKEVILEMLENEDEKLINLMYEHEKKFGEKIDDVGLFVENKIKLLQEELNVEPKKEVLTEEEKKEESDLEKMYRLAGILTEKKIPTKGTPDYHQHKIALDTVKNPMKAMLGGPSKKEAIEILKKKFGYSDADIKKLG